jgi:hypothetical protein
MRTRVAEKLGAESPVGAVGHRCAEEAPAPAVSGLAAARLLPGEFIYLVRSFDELVDE